LFEGGVAAQLFRARALKEFSSLSYTLQTTTESVTGYNVVYRGYKIS
jgi:hypothetical protein